ncbi:MAG: alpha-2-macroglobulin family protein [Caldilineaceae bacterium]
MPERPAYATGSLNLSVPPLARTLALEVTPAETALAPGSQTTLDLALTDADGAPVADAEVAVIVVDEAILALTGYQLTDPVAVFYGTRGSYISDYHSRSSIVLANPLALAQQVSEQQETAMFSRSAMPTAGAPMAAPMAADSAAEESFAMAAEAPPADAVANADLNKAAQPGITLRTNFNPLALFAPSITTDADGHAQVDVQLPDNLTRYRIMAVAVAGENKFGSAEANLTARLPLMVRPSAPRFLNFGDRFELPIVLQNQTDEAMEVNVAVQASNIDLTDVEADAGISATQQLESAGQTVTVPANDRVEVRFPAAAMSAGTARFQIAAVSGSDTDAASVELPVYTPATTEAFAVYGVVDQGAVIQPVAKPTDVFPQFGGLEIQTSSTALQALTDALLYLTAYPYDCSEQLASRIMAIATLRDVLTAFDAAGLPSSDEMMAAVERDAKTLQSLQNYDGGWPVWTRGRESIPYYSIFVAHALQVARDKGFPVTEETRQMSLQYLRQIEQYYPTWYSQQTRWALSAYALNVRNLMGDVDGPKARALFAESGVDKMPLEGLAWLLPILADDPSAAAEADAIRQHFNNRAVETAGAANFTTSYGDDEYVMLHSNRRTDGVILDALITDQPQSDLIPKVVNGLLAHRTRGRWNNTQENAFILLALDHYFNTFEAQTPDFVANIWLGETYAGGHEFVGRTTERHETQIPMRYLVDQQAADRQDLIVGKEGDGRLYYRLGLRYAPTDLEMPPLDMGFVVQREYEAVDDPQDVSRDDDGTWRIRAGARVRVRISMVADSRRYNVALVDPLPAGLEIINPALAVSENIPTDPGDASGRSWWWWGTWYEHQNLRDQRAEAFTTLLWDGVYTYSYVARATTPGQFVAPPAKAEEMYSPEVFGRSAVDKVIVQ